MSTCGDEFFHLLLRISGDFTLGVFFLHSGSKNTFHPTQPEPNKNQASLAGSSSK